MSNVLSGLYSIIANRKFEQIAKQFGFSVTEAYDILQTAFKKKHKGVSHTKYLAKHWLEAEMKEDPKAERNDIILKNLPTFEFIVYGTKDTFGKKWKNEYEKMVMKRTKQQFNDRAKKIDSTIRRIDEASYKKWIKGKSDKEFEDILKQIFISK